MPRPTALRLTALLDPALVVGRTGAEGDPPVTSVHYDSRRVEPGAVFFCLPGVTDDGHRHAGEAVRRGASALVGEQPVATDPAVPQIVVRPGSGRAAMARAAATLHGDPSLRLLVAGVTGTNGKTTVTHLLGSVLEHGGWPTTVIGTLSGRRTTPEAPELQAILASARDAADADGVARAVSMEVSSHALAQHRVDRVSFDVAVFTNLSHEHLDFHGSMDEYFAAKASLFTPERTARGVVDADDPWGRRLLETARIPLVPVHESAANDVELRPGWSSFSWRGQRVEVALTGRFNVVNALLAAEAATALGVDPAVAAGGLRRAGPVPGRMELVDGPPFAVLVDYSHTPAALEHALAECRRLAGRHGRVVVVFGCGGERDAAKRPLMGAVAANSADRVVLTDDNPRGEDPEAIVAQVRAGVPAGVLADRVTVCHDRSRAIALALDGATAGDVVLVAGKGHETYQETAAGRVPFDDRAAVREAFGLEPAEGG